MADSSINACADVTGDPALALVNDAWETFYNFAVQGYNLVSTQVEAITNFTIDFHSWDGSFTPAGDLTPFQRPDRPDLQDITLFDLTGAVPEAPTPSIPDLVLSPPPEEPAFLETPPDPTINLGDEPDPFDAERPGAAPELDLPDAPTAPTLTLPTAPDLEAITVPDAPTITVTAFDEDPPEFDATPPSETIDFTETVYGSDLLTAIKATITDMLAGRKGLSAAVEAALYDRAVGREDTNALRALTEVREGFASRGWDEPPGMLHQKELQVLQGNANRRSELSREQHIQAENIAIENVRLAVTNGLQAEGMLLQAHLTVEGRKFDLAVKQRDVAIAVFNAHVAAYQAAVTQYNARIEAYRAFLDGLRAQIDLYRGQVEAARARGEINEQRARLYAEQIRGELAKAELYRGEVEGYRARIEGEKARIDAYRSEVEAYKAFVEAYREEWAAVRARLDVAIARGEIYGKAADAFATRIRAWAEGNKEQFAAFEQNIRGAEFQMRGHEAALATLRTQIDAARGLTAAQASRADAQTRLYQADTALEGVVSDSNTRQFQAETERARTATELRAQDAQMQIAQLIQRAGLLLRALESAAQASSQFSASSMSAVNFSAGVSSSQGRSRSCNTSFTFSGDTADAGI